MPCTADRALPAKELKLTLERADALITDSDYTRQELADYFAWPIERIHAVPLSSSPEFFPRSAEALRETLARHGLEAGGYSLFVGTIEPRKNLDTLLDAYGKLPLALRKRWPLILTGYHGWRSGHSSAYRPGTATGLGALLGFRGQRRPALLYAGARLFTFPRTTRASACRCSKP